MSDKICTFVYHFKNKNMGAYMYPIIIKRESQKINVEKEVNLGYDCNLTLADLKSHGVKNNDSFSIYENDSKEYILYISSKRFETKKELKLRIQKEERYMLKYFNHQNI